MTRRIISIFIPLGLLLLFGTRILHNQLHSNYSDFTVGLLLGISVAMLIVGIVKQRRNELK